jgi:hypothetical protein
MRDFTIGNIAWGVTSQFLTFVSHHSSTFLQAVFLIVFLTQLTAVLHAGSQVSCHNFHSLHLCFNKGANPGRPWLFMPENVSLLEDSLHTKAIEAVKLCITSSTSSSEFITYLPAWCLLLLTVSRVVRICFHFNVTSFDICDIYPLGNHTSDDRDHNWQKYIPVLGKPKAQKRWNTRVEAILINSWVQFKWPQ